MFHKDNSSVQSTGSKAHKDKKTKAKDVPLRKSDRRSLRQRAAQVLSLSSAREDRLMDAIFLEGSLVSRQIQLPDAKASLYFRSPSKENDENENLWPYHESSQCVWIQLDSKTLGSPESNRNEAVVIDLPSLPLLSVLSCTSADSVILPTVAVPSEVSKFLCRGAHLMRAGMRQILLPSCVARAVDVPITQQRVVALVVQGNTQPFAVGLLAPDLVAQNQDSHLNMGVGTQGVGVAIVTCYGDDLWRQQRPHSGMGTSNKAKDTSRVRYDDGDYGNVGFVQGKMVIPVLGTDNKEEEREGDVETNESETSGEKAEVDVAVPVFDGNDTMEPNGALADEAIPIHDSAPTGKEAQATKQNLEREPETKEPSAEEILHAAVCSALAGIQPKKQLPMLISNFYAQYVIPSRPTGTTIELKRTRYKKFGVYVSEQVEAGLLTVGPDAAKKDPAAVLLGYNRRHADLQPYIAQEKASPTAPDSSNRRLVLADLYCIPHHFQSLLRLDPAAVKATDASSEERRGTGMLTSKEVRAILDDYIDRESLVDSNRPEIVVLDGPLTDALYGKNKKQQSNQEQVPERLTRKHVVSAWTNKMQPAFALVELPGSRIVKLGRGKAPCVQIEVSKRQNRKFVTRIRGLEDFELDPAAVCTDVCHRFACSGSIEENPENRAALPSGHVELSFQGNLADELEALLLGDENMTSHGGAKKSPYRLPKTSIEVILRKGVPARKKSAPGKKKS